MIIETKALTEHCRFLCSLQIHFCLIDIEGQLMEDDCCEDKEFSFGLLGLASGELNEAIQRVIETRESQNFATPSGVTKFVRLAPFVEGSEIIGLIAVGTDKLRGDEGLVGSSTRVEMRVERRLNQLDAALERLESETQSRIRVEAVPQRLEAQSLKTKRLETLGSFAGGIAHEFNNMLTVILGNIGLVQMQASKDSSIMEAIDSLEIATLQAAKLTNQLLSFSGRSRVVETVISLSRLVREFGPLLRISATGECELSIETAASIPGIQGDVGQLHDVLIGLVTNARASYGNSGGRISIKTGVVAMGKGDFLDCHVDKGFSAGDWVYFEVIDQGSGISDSVRKDMFEPFFSTSDKHTGLGLSACLGLVSAQGGTMAVVSKEGEGTTVRVLFPALVEERTESSVAPMVLLVVDNDPAVLETTQHLLHNLEHEAFAARSGPEAVEMFSRRHREIDGVLLDKTMVGMSGLECFEIIKAINPATPVVIMTGFDELSVESDFGKGMVTAVLPKPFKVSSLLEALGSIQASRLRAKETV